LSVTRLWKVTVNFYFIFLLLNSLQTLHVGDTGLKKVFFPGEESTSLFPSLIELSLQNNELNDASTLQDFLFVFSKVMIAVKEIYLINLLQWDSVNELNKLKSLQSLLFQFNPLMEKPKAFDLIVGRVKGLKVHCQDNSNSNNSNTLKST